MPIAHCLISLLISFILTRIYILGFYDTLVWMIWGILFGDIIADLDHIPYMLIFFDKRAKEEVSGLVRQFKFVHLYKYFCIPRTCTLGSICRFLIIHLVWLSFLTVISILFLPTYKVLIFAVLLVHYICDCLYNPIRFKKALVRV